MLVHLLRTLKGDGDMTVFEAISLMIAFATLVVGYRTKRVGTLIPIIER